MDLTTLIDLYLWLSGIMPAPALFGLLLLFGGASAVTNLFPTPARPQPGAPLSARLWFAIYRLCEWAAWITDRAKQRPDEARQILAAVNHLRSAPAFSSSAPALDGIVKAAQELAGKPASNTSSSAGPRTGLGVIAFLLLAGSVLLPGCVGSSAGPAITASSISTAQRWLPLIETAADAYCASPGAKPAVVDGVKAAKEALRASLVAAERAVKDGEDPADAALMAGVDAALGEALAILLRQGVRVEAPR